MTAIVMTASLLLGGGFQQSVEDSLHRERQEQVMRYVAAHERSEAKERASRGQRRQEKPAPRPAEPEHRVVRRSGGCGGWDDLVAAYFPNEVGKACRVLMCESAGDPGAIGPVQRDGTPRPVGLMQIKGGSTDPQANMALAAQMRAARGWKPWACA